MNRAFTLVIFLVLFLCGCSSIAIIPAPSTPGAVVNPSDRSIKIANNGLTVSARVQDTAVGGYEIDTPLASFYLTTSNNTEHPLHLDLDSFLLTNSMGEPLRPISPDNVNAILNPQIGLFLPYPFVGYYDVIDLEQHRAATAMASDFPYAGSGLPAVDILSPLPLGPLPAGEFVTGMLYFGIEMYDESAVELRADINPSKGRQTFSYRFPFTIEK